MYVSDFRIYCMNIYIYIYILVYFFKISTTHFVISRIFKISTYILCMVHAFVYITIPRNVYRKNVNKSAPCLGTHIKKNREIIGHMCEIQPNIFVEITQTNLRKCHVQWPCMCENISTNQLQNKFAHPQQILKWQEHICGNDLNKIMNMIFPQNRKRGERNSCKSHNSKQKSWNPINNAWT